VKESTLFDKASKDILKMAVFIAKNYMLKLQKLKQTPGKYFINWTVSRGCCFLQDFKRLIHIISNFLPIITFLQVI
jgi:hypothetical protein